jgi:SET domain-containing protein
MLFALSFFCFLSIFYNFRIIDATVSPEKPEFGRLINHRLKKPNLVPKVIVDSSGKHLVFQSLKYIKPGEELLYDYKETRQSVLCNYPWLKC